MKINSNYIKLKRFCFLVICFFIVFETEAQDSYSFIGSGDWGIEWAMVFEVEDDYNGRPLSGVIIELLDGRSIVSTVKTDSHGRAVILVKEVKYFESDMTVRAYKDNYSGWKNELGSQWDFISEAKKNQFGLLSNDADYRSQDILMNPKNMEDSEIIPKILQGDFKYLKKSVSGYGGTGGPGLFAYNFALSYDRHPSERGKYNNRPDKDESTDSEVYIDDKLRRGKRIAVISYNIPKDGYNSAKVDYKEVEGTVDEITNALKEQLPQNAELQHIFVGKLGERYFCIDQYCKNYRPIVHVAGFGESLSQAKNSAKSAGSSYYFSYSRKYYQYGTIDEPYYLIK